jgi:hypothetical protein
MPAAPACFPYLSRKYRKIVLRYPIPKTAQPILGKKMFRLVMPQADMAAAHAASVPIVAAWKQRIEDALTANTDRHQAEVLRFRTAFERYDGKRLGGAGLELFGRFVDFIVDGGIVANIETALQTNPTPVQVRQDWPVVPGQVQPATAFLHHLETFKTKTHLKGKHLDSCIREVEAFAKAHPKLTLESVTGGIVQTWIDRMMRPDSGDGVLPGTVAHYLASLRAYWGWMQEHELVPQDLFPFSKRKIKDGRAAAAHA